MATATFPASFVYDRVMERAVELEMEQLSLREAAIVKIMERKIVEGSLWWKTERYPDRAEAMKIYEKADGFCGSEKYWTEYTPKQRLARLAPLERIAAATIQSGADGLVALTPDDCAALDIPVSFKVVAA